MAYRTEIERALDEMISEETGKREEFITWLMEPANSDICRDQLGIAPSMTPDLAPAYERAREAARWIFSGPDPPGLKACK